jgi:hypothetical protein
MALITADALKLKIRLEKLGGGGGITRDGWSVPLSSVVVELAAATTHGSG